MYLYGTCADRTKPYSHGCARRHQYFTVETGSALHLIYNINALHVAVCKQHFLYSSFVSNNYGLVENTDWPCRPNFAIHGTSFQSSATSQSSLPLSNFYILNAAWQSKPDRLSLFNIKRTVLQTTNFFRLPNFDKFIQYDPQYQKILHEHFQNQNEVLSFSCRLKPLQFYRVNDAGRQWRVASVRVSDEESPGDRHSQVHCTVLSFKVQYIVT